MGTSKCYGGPSKGLVPSWVDDPAPGVLSTTSSLIPVGSDVPGNQNPVSPDQPATDKPGETLRPDVPYVGSFRGPRGSFSRFAGTGSLSSLGSALSGYVRRGTGGAQRAARRMGASRSAGARLLGIVRDVQRLGATEALRQTLNLPELAGRPASDVFLALTDFVCPPGGKVDEGIARQAMLDSIGDLAEAGLETFDTFTTDQLHEFFLEFLVRSIEGRIMADIGGRGITLPNDVAAVENVQEQLHDFVAGCTRGVLTGRLDNIEALSNRDLGIKVDEIYEAAFELVAAAGEAVA